MKMEFTLYEGVMVTYGGVIMRKNNGTNLFFKHTKQTDGLQFCIYME